MSLTRKDFTATVLTALAVLAFFATHEAWNIRLGLVWHWNGLACKCYENCYHPLCNVADNGILIVNQLTSRAHGFNVPPRDDTNTSPAFPR